MKKSKMNYFLMDNFKEANIKSFRTELLRIENQPNFDCGNWMNNESLSESCCEIIETNFKFSPLQQQIFNELNFKGIDTGYFIDDSGFPDDDSFEKENSLILHNPVLIIYYYLIVQVFVMGWERMNIVRKNSLVWKNP